MDITIQAAIIGALVGSATAGIVSYFVSRKTISTSFDLIHLQERNKALATFRNAFLPELIFLKHNAKVTGAGTSNNLGEFLFSGYLRQLEALEVFRSSLSTKDNEGISKAWNQYCHHPNNSETLCFEQYSCEPTGRDRETDLKRVALERIEEILRFAEHIK